MSASANEPLRAAASRACWIVTIAAGVTLAMPCLALVFMAVTGIARADPPEPRKPVGWHEASPGTWLIRPRPEP